MIANILRSAARAAFHFLARKEIKLTRKEINQLVMAVPHRHEWVKSAIFESHTRSPGGNQVVIEWCPQCGTIRPPQPKGKAWDLRRDARSHYPGNIRLQRKWIKAWKRSPGPMVPISTTYVSPPHDPSMGGLR